MQGGMITKVNVNEAFCGGIAAEDQALPARVVKRMLVFAATMV